MCADIIYLSGYLYGKSCPLGYDFFLMCKFVTPVLYQILELVSDCHSSWSLLAVNFSKGDKDVKMA